MDPAVNLLPNNGGQAPQASQTRKLNMPAERFQNGEQGSASRNVVHHPHPCTGGKSGELKKASSFQG